MNTEHADKYIKVTLMSPHNAGEFFEHYLLIGARDTKTHVELICGQGVFKFMVYEGVGTNEQGDPASYQLLNPKALVTIDTTESVWKDLDQMWRGECGN